MANFGMRLGLGMQLAGRSFGGALGEVDPLSDIPDLVMRLESWQPDTFLTASEVPAANNEAVATIVDRMASFNATQSVETQQGIWKTNQINGHGALLLDAADDGYSTECDLGTAYTIIVASNTSIGPSRRTINSLDHNALISTSRTFAAVYSGATVVSDTSAYADQWVIGVLRVNGSVSNFRANSADITDNATSGNPWGRLSIGYPGDNQEPVGGLIASVYAFTRSLTDGEVQIIESYVSQKTGITLGS